MYGRVADADTNESVYVFVFDSFDLKTEVNIDCMFSINRMARNLHVFDPTPARTCSVVIPAWDEARKPQCNLLWLLSLQYKQQADYVPGTVPLFAPRSSAAVPADTAVCRR